MCKKFEMKIINMEIGPFTDYDDPKTTHVFICRNCNKRYIDKIKIKWNKNRTIQNTSIALEKDCPNCGTKNNYCAVVGRKYKLFKGRKLFLSFIKT